MLIGESILPTPIDSLGLHWPKGIGQWRVIPEACCSLLKCENRRIGAYPPVDARLHHGLWTEAAGRLKDSNAIILQLMDWLLLPPPRLLYIMQAATRDFRSEFRGGDRRYLLRRSGSQLVPDDPRTEKGRCRTALNHSSVLLEGWPIGEVGLYIISFLAILGVVQVVV